MGLVQSVTYQPPPEVKRISCDFCPQTFASEQGYSVHRGMLHAQAHAHEGTRLLKSLRDGTKIAMWPWEGVGLGRFWVAGLGIGADRATVFQLQPKRLRLNDGFGCDDDEPAGTTGRRGAGTRRAYSTGRRQQLLSACGDISDKPAL